MNTIQKLTTALALSLPIGLLGCSKKEDPKQENKITVQQEEVKEVEKEKISSLNELTKYVPNIDLYDLDKDNVISKEEMNNYTYGEIDKNKDKKFSYEELIDFYHLYTKFQEIVGDNPVLNPSYTNFKDKYFVELNAHNLEIERWEMDKIRKITKNPGAEGNMEGLLKKATVLNEDFPYLYLFDLNKNEIIDVDEADLYVKVHFDKNGDGKLSEKELAKFYASYNALFELVKNSISHSRYGFLTPTLRNFEDRYRIESAKKVYGTQ